MEGATAISGKGPRIDVVIPAYKSRFLRPLLDSLAAQTCQDFGVVVADDASPDPLLQICESYASSLHLRYHRFERNMGGQDLAGHWNRSISLSNGDWIMLPGDDDAYDTNCIAALRRRLATGDHDVVSFAVRTLDEHSRFISDYAAAEARSPFEFLSNLHTIYCPAPVGYAFSRQIYEKTGGFVSFDSGWHSDDASWAMFGAKKGIARVPDATVSWRQSGLTLTQSMIANPMRRLRAEQAFVAWLFEHASQLGLSDIELANLIEKCSWWIYPVAASLGFTEFAKESLSSALLLRRHGSRSVARHLFRFARQRWFLRP